MAATAHVARTPSRSRAPETSREPRPVLTVIEGGQRRYVRAMVVAVVTSSLMFGVVAGRAHMAAQQMKLDRLNSDVRRARSYFDELRAQRAELQSPEFLLPLVRAMGMVPSVGNKVVQVSPEVAAAVASTVGKVDSDIADAVESPLDEFGRIKASVGAG